ncbi:hypothetical protein CPB84DRAFT_1688818, partial [Gymnopilus junonius]
LDDCLCGLRVDPTADDVIECKRPGCETRWYHLICVSADQALHNWACEACTKSTSGRGGKVAWR